MSSLNVSCLCSAPNERDLSGPGRQGDTQELSGKNQRSPAPVTPLGLDLRPRGSGRGERRALRQEPPHLFEILSFGPRRPLVVPLAACVGLVLCQKLSLLRACVCVLLGVGF